MKMVYYTDLFNEVKDCRSYWKLVKNATNSRSAQPILAIRNSAGEVVISDEEKANALNVHFSTIGEKLACALPGNEQSLCFK